MSRFELVSASPDETRAFGRVLASALEAGDVLVLTGDLGAGKTQLTKGIAEGLGAEGEVTSPTFALEAVHEGGRLPLYHFDLYRLSDPDQLGDAGVWDVLGADGICVIEWGEQFADDLGEERVDVFITRDESEAVEADGEPERRVELVSHEARGESFVEAVREAMSRKGD